MANCNLKKLVVKLGSSSLSAPGGGLDEAYMANLAEQVGKLRSLGWETLLVSSGAVRSGLQLLGVDQPDELTAQQALAAVGQSALMNTWGRAFQKQQLHVGQVLLTRYDLEDRARYLNARACLVELFRLGVVPVVNENDTVAVDELCFGDNDTLAAMVASMLDADLLVLLTDVEGFYSDLEQKTVIREVASVDKTLFALDFGKGDSVSRGGMATKLQAARLATKAGIEVVLAHARADEVLVRAADGQEVGTRFVAQSKRLENRKRWLAYARVKRGTLTVNDGARLALLERGKSLLAAGLVKVAGRFEAGDLVDIADEAGEVLARGLVRYGYRELQQVMGLRSAEARKQLGDEFVCEEVVHRDDMVVNP